MYILNIVEKCMYFGSWARSKLILSSNDEHVMPSNLKRSQIRNGKSDRNVEIIQTKGNRLIEI